jgi:hypothetical protein
MSHIFAIVRKSSLQAIRAGISLNTNCIDTVGEWQNEHYKGHFSFQIASQKARKILKTALCALLPPEIPFANRVLYRRINLS